MQTAKVKVGDIFEYKGNRYVALAVVYQGDYAYRVFVVTSDAEMLPNWNSFHEPYCSVVE